MTTIDLQADLLILGGGPGGYTAAFRAADLGRSVVLIDRWDRLGGVCLNVGCIPSKALLHAAKVITDADEFTAHGIRFSKPTVDLDALRTWKDSVVARLTGGLEDLARLRKVTVVRGARAVRHGQHRHGAKRRGHPHDCLQPGHRRRRIGAHASPLRSSR